MVSTSQQEVVLDSLPYAETLHEDYEEYALAMMEEEMQKFQPRPLATKMLPLPNRTQLLQAEYSGLIQNGEYHPRSADNSYQIPTKPSKGKNLSDWQGVAIPQAKAQLEAERLRGLTLEAEKEDTVANHKVYIATLEAVKTQWIELSQKQREEVEETNYQRQQSQQQQLGPRLDELTEQYQQALYRRNHLAYTIEGIQRQQADAGINSNE